MLIEEKYPFRVGERLQSVTERLVTEGQSRFHVSFTRHEDNSAVGLPKSRMDELNILQGDFVSVCGCDFTTTLNVDMHNTGQDTATLSRDVQNSLGVQPGQFITVKRCSVPEMVSLNRFVPTATFFIDLFPRLNVLLSCHSTIQWRMSVDIFFGTSSLLICLQKISGDSLCWAVPRIGAIFSALPLQIAEDMFNSRFAKWNLASGRWIVVLLVLEPSFTVRDALSNGKTGRLQNDMSFLLRRFLMSNA